MLLELYRTTDDNNVINKTLTDKKEIDIELKRSETEQTPNIALNTVAFDKPYNYAYIGLFNRYYFINAVERLTNGIVILSLVTDVLETYKTDILSSRAVVKRQRQLNYVSAETTFDVRKEVTHYYGNVELGNSQTNILTTIGG